MALCLIHANCQGEPLQWLLSQSPAFSKHFKVHLHTNYTGQPIPEALLQECSLFLYQNLGAHWGELASARTLAHLPAASEVLCLPNMFFKGYWPLWTSESSMNFGDELLDTLVDKGLSLAEIKLLAMSQRLLDSYAIDSRLENSLNFERQRERACFFAYTQYIEEHWRSERLFTTVNHPARPLLHMVAQEVLKALGLPPLSPAVLAQALSCDPSFEQPIHPLVAAHYGLPVDSHTRYPVYGKQLSYAEYLVCYIDCRQRALNFLEYLQAVQVD